VVLGNPKNPKMYRLPAGNVESSIIRQFAREKIADSFPLLSANRFFIRYESADNSGMICQRFLLFLTVIPMKNLACLLFFSCLFLTACNSELPVEQLTYKNGLKTVKDSGEPFTGLAVQLNSNNQPIEIIEYKAGKLDGQIQRWYPNGELKEEFNARLDSEFYLLAQAAMSDADQRKVSKLNEELDEIAKNLLIRYGEERKWYDNGELQSEGQYSDDGLRKIGTWRTWYKNGKLQQQGSYLSLPEKPENNLKKRRRFKVEGTKTGVWKKWYDNGELFQEEYYDDNGLKTGVWRTYCKNNTVGKQSEYQADLLVGIQQYWGCDGKKLDHQSYDHGKKHGSFAHYASKKGNPSNALVNIVNSDNQFEYAVNSEDFYLYQTGFFDQDKKSGIWKSWDKTGKLMSTIDYSKEHFINPEYAKPFLKQGKFGPYATGRSRWRTNYYNFKSARPDHDAITLFIEKKLIDPAKKIITQRPPRWDSQYNQGVSHWTYPIIVAPEALYDFIKKQPGVTADSHNSQGQNRLHICSLLMLGTKPGRCSFEHFATLVQDIPVNATDNEGLAPVNYIAAFRKPRYRSSITEETASKAINLLVNAGADINHQNQNGLTPLMMALNQKNYAVAKTLLNLGANPNLQDNEGRNAIHYVFFQPSRNRYRFKLRKKDQEIVTFLSQKGTKIDLPDSTGKSVIDHALKQGAIKTSVFLNSLIENKTSEKTDASPDEKQLEQALPKSNGSNLQTTINETEIPPLQSNLTTKNNQSAYQPTETESSTASPNTTLPTTDTTVDRETALYQTALSQIKHNRLSRPKGDSALDTVNKLSSLTSKNDPRVIELRHKIAEKYLSLARGRISHYRYQDAVKLIKASQKIHPSSTANQLLLSVNQRIAEEKAFQQKQFTPYTPPTTKQPSGFW
jgi:antitoxin component YwqK of YwqJK toxin-antitoxin module/ankyrin repeat protein